MISLGLDLGVSFWQPAFKFNDVEVYMDDSIQAMILGVVIAAVAAATTCHP